MNVGCVPKKVMFNAAHVNEVGGTFVLVGTSKGCKMLASSLWCFRGACCGSLGKQRMRRTPNVGVASRHVLLDPHSALPLPAIAMYPGLYVGAARLPPRANP